MPLDDNRLISPAMIAVFMLVFCAATIARLPAAIMLPYFEQAGVKASGADGTVWEARFSGLSYQQMRFDNGSYTLEPLGFITGNGLGDFTLFGDIASLKGQLLSLSGNRIHLAGLSVAATYPLTIRRMALTPHIDMASEKLVLSQDGQCVSGDIDLSISLNNQVLKRILPQVDRWDGSASCDDGQASFLLNPRDSSLIAVIRGSLNGNRYKADIDLSLEDGFDESSGLKAALKSAGFKKQQGRWKAQIKGIL